METANYLKCLEETITVYLPLLTEVKLEVVFLALMEQPWSHLPTILAFYKLNLEITMSASIQVVTVICVMIMIKSIQVILTHNMINRRCKEFSLPL
jgi:hypothetical protein